MSEETKKNVIDPMTILSEADIEKENKEAEALFKAIRFGCPGLYTLLNELYKAESMKGLTTISQKITRYDLIKAVVNNRMRCSADVIDTESWEAKLTTIIGIINGDICVKDLVEC